MNRELEKLFNKLNLSLDLITNYGLKIEGDVIFDNNDQKWHLTVSQTIIFSLDDFKEVYSRVIDNNIFAIKFINNLKIINDEVLKYYFLFFAETNDKFLNSFLYTKQENINSINKKIIFDINDSVQKNIIQKWINYNTPFFEQFGFFQLQYDFITTPLSEEEVEKKESVTQVTNANNLKPIIKKSEPKKNNFKNAKNKSNSKNSISIADIIDEEEDVVVTGEVFNSSFFETKSGWFILTISITDYHNSIRIKMFIKDENKLKIYSNFKKGQWIKTHGAIRYDKYDKDLVIIAKEIESTDSQLAVIKDEFETKRVELHLHTRMSVMDGVSGPDDYFKKAQSLGHKAIAFSDHLNVQAFPEIYNTSKKFPDIKPIYGVEMEIIDEVVKYSWNNKGVNLKETKFVIFDLETTGLNSNYDEIIEFGAVTLEKYNQGASESIDLLIKSTESISSFTTELTGITNQMLKDKPSIKEVFPKIIEYCKDAVLVAHNANFDMNFLQSWAVKLGYPPFDNVVIDTLQIARALKPQLKSYRLGKVCSKYNVEYNEAEAHRADYDAEVLARLFLKMFDEMFNNYKVETDHDIINIHKDVVYNYQYGKHIVVLVKNQAGLKDLFKLISKSYIDRFYKSPKIFVSDIIKVRDNLLIGSACVNGQVFDDALNKSDKELIETMDFFDYIEVQPLSVYKHLVQKGNVNNTDLQKTIQKIIKLGKQNNKIVVVTGDVHYANDYEKIIREIYIHSKGLGGINHPLFDYKQRIQDFPDQYYRSTQQMIDEFHFLNDMKLTEEIVITNPNLINDQIENIQIIKDKLYTPKIDNADNLLKELCYKNTKKIYGEIIPELIKKRLDRELDSIIKHGFGVIYWTAHQLVKKSINSGYLVGSRGSVGSSFVATMAEITEVNPLAPHYICAKCQFSNFDIPKDIRCGYDLETIQCPKCGNDLYGEGHNIPFETFLGFNADKVPDIDLNFSGDYQEQAHNYTKELFGEKYVYRAGTISTVASKTAYGYVRNFLETKQILTDYRQSEVDRLTQMCEKVKRTTGQHPGGIIVVPNEYEIEDFCPINYPADDINSHWYTTHFDFHSIHDNLLKLDILGHVDPTALKMLERITGVNPITIKTNDKEVISLFNNLNTLNITNPNFNEPTGALGIPEFGTNFVRQMLTETKPKSFADLVQISGLSHGTDVYVGNAKDLIENKTVDISEVIGCRDDIMTYLINHNLDPKLSFDIMEAVRKGKGLTDDNIAILKKHNVPEWYIKSCLKIKYMFPKAHATAYVLMAFRIAWYKINFPCEHYATYFTTRSSVFDIWTIHQGYSAVFTKIQYITNQLNSDNKKSVTQKEKDLLPIYEIALEMLSRDISLDNVSIFESAAREFTIKKEGNVRSIIPPLTAIDGLGDAVADSIVCAREEKPFSSIADFKKRTSVGKNIIEEFQRLNALGDLPEDDQLTFDF
ncbi:PolC-type DNA polymerase III [Spiroplasma endosymbiont of Amphibalanus improvisus]|uniref:PolC-type DNA polymerase III n=1 Tax=Spiroplasma endosymbiont of Amphibalanus improvisus TaxID=3066327 RepID=UPI00313F347C